MLQQSIEERTDTDALDRCAVCQMEFEAGDDVSTLPCTHFYHPDCIGEWFKDRKVRAGFPLRACLQASLRHRSTHK